jgi:NTP pyrophosphatase (non-canonical NTP hydrolase)
MPENKQLSIENIQKNVDNFITNHGGYWPPLSMLSAVIEEVGELAREINHLEGFKPKRSNEPPAIGEELADILFAIVCIANYYKINLRKEFEEVLKKYSIRDSNRFKK